LFFGSLKHHKGLRQNRRNPFSFLDFHSKATQVMKRHSIFEMHKKAIFMRQDLRQEFGLKAMPALVWRFLCRLRLSREAAMPGI
jgi:hypothetical protein